MTIVFTQIRKARALGVLFTSLTFLAACGSGSDSNNDGGIASVSNEESLAPAINPTGPEAELLGGWVVCNETGGLRFEYEFDATSYSNSVGAGSCAGFDSADQVLVNAGSYEITGTTLSDSGLTALTMELTTLTINGSPVFESLIETRFRLAYTGTQDQLVFSSDTFEGQDRSLTLDLDLPYVRFR